MNIHQGNIVLVIYLLALYHCTAITYKRLWKKTYDYVIVGGGTAGCVVANRLTENPDISVLVVEAGKDVINDPVVSIPRTWLNILNDLPELMWGYHGYLSEPIPGLNNRKLKMAASYMLGGATSNNALQIVRGSKHDFDWWKELGNEGWGYDDVLPYFIKSEGVLENDLLLNGNHGTNGPWKIRYAQPHEIQNKFINAAKELGFKKSNDISIADEGIGAAQLDIDSTGRRSSTAEAYLKPILGRHNLDVVTEAHVTKINIKDKKATGVSFMVGGSSFAVKARTEVILSAGALNSPQILMLSGIGPREHLQQHDIHVVADLPVGNTLKDHMDLRKLLFSSNLTNPKIFSTASLFEYLYQGKGYWSNTGSQAIGFFRSKTQSTGSKVPFIELIMGVVLPSIPLHVLNYVRNGTAIPEHLIQDLVKSEDNSTLFFISPVLMHPRNNSGSVRLRSSDPMDHPVLKMNHLQHEDDVKDMVEAIRLIQQLLKTEALRSIDANDITEKDPDCLKHGFDTDNYWVCHLRNTVTAAQHHTSTCMMDPSGVVDSNLRVKGVAKLRVVDASVIPDYITGHTMAATIMLAEKASDMIKDDNGHSMHLDLKMEEPACENHQLKMDTQNYMNLVVNKL